MFLWLFFIVSSLTVFHGVEGKFFVSYPEEARLSTEEIIQKYGYPLEIHYATSKDGYILKMQRIPVGSKCEEEKKKNPFPIVTVNGIGGSSRFYVVSAEKGPAFTLSRNCYDVWLANTRGNYESRNHTHLDPNKSKFWKYSFHEKGIYDLPAIMDYIISKTNSSQIHYVGHSEGTAAFFAMASLLPEYSSKTVRSMHALSPVAFYEHSKSPFYAVLSEFFASEEFLSKLLGFTDISRSTFLVPMLSRLFCTIERPAFLNNCAQILDAAVGYDFMRFNATSMLILLGAFPAGLSMRDNFHLMQLRSSGKFRQFDYLDDNMKKYGQSTPPDYPIERIRVPMYLYASNNDFFAAMEDVEHFADLTPTSTIVDSDGFSHYNHLDFLIANNAEVISNKIVENLKIHT